MSTPTEDLRTTTRSARLRGLWAGAATLPNQLTALRLVLAIVLFVLLAWDLYFLGLLVFLIATGTDWLDGYLARKYNLVTTLGRILDPFADKVIICGTFVFLAAAPEMLATPWGVRPWMVVVIVGRELLVTALRSFIEEQGGDFSAKTSGKIKMVLQCVAGVTALLYLSSGPAETPGWVSFTVYATMIAAVWSAVALTVYSGAVYVLQAARLVQRQP